MRMDKNPTGWTEKRLKVALADMVKSYNNTKNSKTGLTPASCNFPEFVPILREKLYGDRKIEKFEDFYTEKLRLHKEANTPEKEEDKPNFDESSYKPGDWVYIDFKKPNVGRLAYRTQRGRIYEVLSVNVQNIPYVYKLKDIKTSKPLHGFYYAKELARASLSDLQVENIIKRRTTPEKKKLIFVKFKGLDKSYNRWIEEK